MSESANLSSEPVFFLRKRFHFYLTLAVIATTLFSWFNVNSWCILLLLLCRLMDGSPIVSVKKAFSNKYFLAFFVLFLLELLGLTYTHDMYNAWKHMESKATLAAVPFILCAGPFTDRAGRRRLMSLICLLLMAICIYCLCMAVWLYNRDNDPSVFFYHSLSESIGVNAVFFSGYIMAAILYLLSYPLDLRLPLHRFGTVTAPVSATVEAPPIPLSDALLRLLRISLITFFAIMTILLSSKLLLVLLVVVVITFLAGRRRLRIRENLAPVIGLCLLLAVGTIMFVSTDNPVMHRYREIGKGDIGLYKRNSLPPWTVYNGLSLRLLIWKYGVDILSEQRAWVFGVTGGDSQNLLNEKYIQADIYGYIGYNFQNQYMEELVRSGLIGLLIFLASCWALIDLAARTGTREAWFTVAMVLILYATESMLEMQHSCFFSCFFPLLLLPELYARTRPVPQPVADPASRRAFVL
jgi:hypothetical protein